MALDGIAKVLERIHKSRRFVVPPILGALLCHEGNYKFCTDPVSEFRAKLLNVRAGGSLDPEFQNKAQAIFNIFLNTVGLGFAMYGGARLLGFLIRPCSMLVEETVATRLAGSGMDAAKVSQYASLANYTSDILQSGVLVGGGHFAGQVIVCGGDMNCIRPAESVLAGLAAMGAVAMGGPAYRVGKIYRASTPEPSPVRSSTITGGSRATRVAKLLEIARHPDYNLAWRPNQTVASGQRQPSPFAARADHRVATALRLKPVVIEEPMHIRWPGKPLPANDPLASPRVVQLKLSAKSVAAPFPAVSEERSNEGVRKKIQRL